MATAPIYPVQVDGELEHELSRWLWLVKCILVFPHAICLAVLWLAFTVLTVAAFVAVLFTGRYPRGIYGFNVGVLRWSWRVAFYTIGAFGTDRYPPFTLGEAPEYPARLAIAYPEHLPRGPRLVGRWLLGIPHYIVATAFAGGGWFVLQQHALWFSSPGLVGALAVIAAIVLLWTGRYPRSLFDFLLGLDRWVLRAAAYAAFLTDEYPPFRLDPGEHELDIAGAAGREQPPAAAATGSVAASGRPTLRHWLGIVLGSLGVVLSLGLVAGGAVGLWADRSSRDAGGYLLTPSRPLATQDFALESESLDMHWHGPAWLYPSRILGTIQLRATSAAPARPIFIGIARTRDADRYLDGVAHGQVRDISVSPFRVHNARTAGGPPRARPADTSIWVASAVGTGAQRLTWKVRSGSFTVVMMNADGSRGVAADVRAGATFPELGWIAGTLLAVGALLLAGSVLIMILGASGWRRAG
jgi:hypothetical protein